MKLHYDNTATRRGVHISVTPCPAGQKVHDVIPHTHNKEAGLLRLNIGGTTCRLCQYFKGEHDSSHIECAHPAIQVKETT